MKLNLKVFHRGLILVGVPLIAGIFVLLSLSYVVIQTDKEVAHGQMLKRVEKDVSCMIATLYHIGYKFDVIFKEGSFEEFSQLPNDLRTVRDLRNDLLSIPFEGDDEKYFASRDALVKVLASLAQTLKPVMEHRSNVYLAIKEAVSKKKELGEVLDQSNAWLQVLLSRSQDEMVEGSFKKQEQWRQIQAAILLGGLASSVALAFVLARFFMRSIVSRLSVITDNARRLTEGLPLLPSLSGNDEISELDGTFHKMAEELKRVAERERALFDNASDVICVLDRAGKFVRVNPASLRIWGRKPEELDGTAMLDLVLAEDRAAAVGAVRRAQGSEPSLQFECRVQCSGERQMESLWQVYWSESEESLFCVVHDISDRKKVERMKQEFLSMVSHDLRSPLTSITGIFELLGRSKYGELSEMAIAKVAVARRNVSRLLTMVNDLLDVEKLEAGQLSLSLGAVEVAGLLERCLQEVETVAQQRGITFKLDACAGEAELDRDRIVQVIVNLLSNAIKFSPENGAVTLSGKIAGGELEISVSDQGRGVPEEARSAIFERFKQAEVADGRRKAGTGLGLPICKQLVELHGGTIGVDSEIGKGSTFWLRLPLTAPAPQSDQLEPAGASVAAVGGSLESGEPAPSDHKKRSIFSGFSLLQDLSLFHKGVLLVGVPVAFELLLVGMLTVVLVQVNNEKNYEHFLHEISFSSVKCVTDYVRLGRAVGLDNSPKAWSDFDEAASDYESTLKHLRELNAQAPDICPNFDKFEQTGKPGLDYTNRARKIMQGKPFSHENLSLAFAKPETLAPVADKLGMMMIPMLAKLDAVESVSPVVQEELRRRQGLLLISGIAVNVLLSLSLAVFFGKGITGRLAALRDNVERFARDENLSPPLAGRDEIAQLDRVFHSMAVALKEARQKERAVFDNSQDVICAIDGDAKFTQVNSSCSRMWGFSPAELLNSTVTSLVVTEDRDILATQLETARKGDAIAHFENSVTCADGSIKDVLWSANWSPDKQLLFCVAHDITKRKELERLKQDFLAMVSHDLRTPLTSVNGITKLLLAGAMGPVPELARQKLEIVVTSVNRLLELINDLMDMEKLDAGQMKLSPEETSARGILEKSAQALEGMARNQKVEVSIDAPDAQINVDEERLIQALVNLLSNAIKFSPEGGTVKLSAAVSDGICEFKVIDQGRGIPEDFKQTIFERFKQVEAADGRRTQGTGLGLPITKRIVEGHGGSIGVESAQGKGSTFWIRIPI